MQELIVLSNIKVKHWLHITAESLSSSAEPQEVVWSHLHTFICKYEETNKCPTVQGKVQIPEFYTKVRVYKGIHPPQLA